MIHIHSDFSPFSYPPPNDIHGYFQIPSTLLISFSSHSTEEMNFWLFLFLLALCLYVNFTQPVQVKRDLFEVDHFPFQTVVIEDSDNTTVVSWEEEEELDRGFLVPLVEREVIQPSASVPVVNKEESNSNNVSTSVPTVVPTIATTIASDNVSIATPPTSSPSHSKSMKHLQEVVLARKERNAVFITIATYAYRLFTVDFYQHSNLTQYRSFFVVTQDELTYSVSSSLYSHF